MEFLSGDGGLEVILFIREIMKDYKDLQESIMEQLGVSISSVKSPSVMRTILWIFGEYSSSQQSILQNFDTITTALGPLPLIPNAADMQADPSDTAADATPRTTVTVLADGTYATQTSLPSTSSNNNNGL